MAKDDGSSRILKYRLDAAVAKQRYLRSAVDGSLIKFYQDPATAVKSINEFLKRNDYNLDVLEKKMLEKPDYFGTRSGSMLSKDGWTHGASERAAQAAAAARELGPNLKKLEEMTKEVRLLEGALAGQAPKTDKNTPPKKAEEKQKAASPSFKDRISKIVKKVAGKDKDDGPDFNGK